MASKINNLGRYGDLSAVWDKHPEGGRDGDFVTIGGTEYLWDQLTRQWKIGSSGGGSSSGETVDGDLNVGGNLNVGGDATIAGTLHVGNIEVEGDRFKGQSSFRMSVFTRSESVPATPSGGKYSDPLPNGLVWREGVPQGSQPIWMSSRTYTSDGQSPQDDWSTPLMLVDSEDFDVEFSNHNTNSVPPDPSSSNLGTVWFDPKRNPNASWQLMNWMATRYKSVNAQGEAEWGTWVIVLIKGARGADGDGFENVFYRTAQKVVPIPSITSINSIFQTDGYCPVVLNKSQCGGVDDNFTANPRGVSEELPYEWVMQRRKRNGQWQAFSTPPVIFATYSKNHTISINDEGYWVIDGTTTGVKAVGKGVSVKGRVDYYSTGSTGYTSGASTLEDITSPEKGDSYVVDDDGHLYLCVDTTGTLEQMWQDLGEFKGEKGDDGESNYFYIAWATDVHFAGNPQVFDYADGYTTNPVEGQSYPWMGILVTNEEIANIAQDTNAGLFKWNYMAGRDGTDYEHVYIRTKIDTAPEIDPACINAQGYQNPEFYPDVDNIDEYTFVDGGSNNTIEGAKFTDDPNGISEEWPYEWQARREKVNGQWQAFQSPAILHRNWAAPGADGADGADGKSAAIVEVSESMLTVDADSGGKISSQLTLTLNCWLKVGGVKKSITSVAAKYGNVTLTRISIQNEQGYILIPDGLIANSKAQITIKLASGVEHTNKNISVTLSDGENEASATVPVTIVRSGAKGDTGARGPVLRFRGAFLEGEQVSYVYNDNYRDCVKHEGTYWMVADYGADLGGQDTPSLQNDDWVYMGDMQFVATQLLLAENGAINLLSSNVINLFSGTEKTASINADGKGSYCIYYPNGKKMMEFNANGFIIYYNNDTNNTVAWTLGYGGEINKTATSDDWKPIRLKKLLPRETSADNINANTHFVLDTFYQFIAGSGSQFSAYGGKIFTGCGTLNPTLETVIPDGDYTLQEDAVQDLEEGKWAVETYPVSGGVIDYSNGTTHYGTAF